MSIVRLNEKTYGLKDSIIGIIATGTLREMKQQMALILACGTEEACVGNKLWNS